ncbi:MAG TPA: SdrD B-like domain-containing protein [Candidatus Anoxymicrobiaceae bacterium]
MRRAIKFQIFALLALLVLIVTVSTGVIASGSGSGTTTSEGQAQVSQPAEVAPSSQPASQTDETVQPPAASDPTPEVAPSTQPAVDPTSAETPATDSGTKPTDTPAATPPAPASSKAKKGSVKSAAKSTQAAPVTAPAQADKPKDVEGPAYGCVEGLVRDGGGNPVDGITFNLYRLDDGGGKTLLGTMASGSGAYGPLWMVWSMAPYPAGWVGWKALPTVNGDNYFVDYELEMVPSAGYYATSATSQSGRIWSPSNPNEPHPFCWWRQFEYTVARKAKLDGYKFKDMNENGKMDEGEPGIAGVKIVLDSDADSALTNQDGYFSFDVEPGNHTVAVDESTALGYYPTTPTSIQVEVPCEGQTTVYFGNAPFGSISGHKWLDPDKDGKLDGDETPVKGVTIKLTGKTSLGDETVNLETTTGEDGSYSFSGLKAGSYTVSEVVPADMEAVSPTSLDVSLKPGDNAKDLDFFNANTKAIIKGYKFLDLNENGQMDAGEVGIAKVTITLDTDKASAITNADGFFSFEVEAGTHVVAVDESSITGYYPTTVTSLDVEVAAGGEKTVYFGNASEGSISGHKWEDPNRNGVHDSGELPVAGVTINLTGTTNVGDESVSKSTVTGTDGSYSFTGLKAGSYTVSEVVPVDMEATAPDSIDVTLDVGKDVTDIDFFNATTATPNPPVPPTQPTTPAATTQATSSTTGTTLPYTGMNQAPFSIFSAVAVGLGLLLLAVGMEKRRRERMQLARSEESIPQVK